VHRHDLENCIEGTRFVVLVHPYHRASIFRGTDDDIDLTVQLLTAASKSILHSPPEDLFL